MPPRRDGGQPRLQSKRWLSNPEPSPGTAGITLFEVLLVLTIVALSASVAMPLMQPDSSQQRYWPTVVMIAADLRAAQSRAMSRNRRTTFELNTSRRTYRVSPGGRKRQLPAGITITVETARPLTSGSIARLMFFPDGSSTGGSIRIALAGRSSRVLVNWLTGRVQIEGDRR